MKKTIETIQALRLEDAPVTVAVINAIAKGIVMANDRTILVEHGGYFEPWSWLGKKCPLPHGKRTQEDGSQNCYDWEDTRGSWTFEGSETVIQRKTKTLQAMHRVPEDLILNLDQTPLFYVCSACHTFYQKGAKVCHL